MRHGVKRARRDRWLMGVCGGIAHTYGWRPSAVRLAAAILAIAIPGPSLVLSLLAYMALGLLLPASDEF
jgi:phage shock protein PspC (stress-responsive transcriptional regulator)